MHQLYSLFKILLKKIIIGKITLVKVFTTLTRAKFDQ